MTSSAVINLVDFLFYNKYIKEHQTSILNQKRNDKIILDFENFRQYINNCEVYLTNIIDHYLFTYNELNKSMMEEFRRFDIANCENIESDHENMELFEKYCRLALQVTLELNYMVDGIANCTAHKNEINLLEAKIDRKSSLVSAHMLKVNNNKELLHNKLNKESNYISSSNEEYSSVSIDSMSLIIAQFNAEDTNFNRNSNAKEFQEARKVVARLNLKIQELKETINVNISFPYLQTTVNIDKELESTSLILTEIEGDKQVISMISKNHTEFIADSIGFYINRKIPFEVEIQQEEVTVNVVKDTYNNDLKQDANKQEDDRRVDTKNLNQPPLIIPFVDLSADKGADTKDININNKRKLILSESIVKEGEDEFSYTEKEENDCEDSDLFIPKEPTAKKRKTRRHVRTFVITESMISTKSVRGINVEVIQSNVNDICEQTQEKLLSLCEPGNNNDFSVWVLKKSELTVTKVKEIQMLTSEVVDLLDSIMLSFWVNYFDVIKAGRECFLLEYTKMIQLCENVYASETKNENVRSLNKKVRRRINTSLSKAVTGLRENSTMNVSERIVSFLVHSAAGLAEATHDFDLLDCLKKSLDFYMFSDTANYLSPEAFENTARGIKDVVYEPKQNHNSIESTPIKGRSSFVMTQCGDKESFSFCYESDDIILAFNNSLQSAETREYILTACKERDLLKLKQIVYNKVVFAVMKKMPPNKCKIDDQKIPKHFINEFDSLCAYVMKSCDLDDDELHSLLYAKNTSDSNFIDPDKCVTTRNFSEKVVLGMDCSKEMISESVEPLDKSVCRGEIIDVIEQRFKLFFSDLCNKYIFRILSEVLLTYYNKSKQPTSTPGKPSKLKCKTLSKRITETDAFQDFKTYCDSSSISFPSFENILFMILIMIFEMTVMIHRNNGERSFAPRCQILLNLSKHQTLYSKSFLDMFSSIPDLILKIENYAALLISTSNISSPGNWNDNFALINLKNHNSIGDKRFDIYLNEDKIFKLFPHQHEAKLDLNVQIEMERLIYEKISNAIAIQIFHHHKNSFSYSLIKFSNISSPSNSKLINYNDTAVNTMEVEIPFNNNKKTPINNDNNNNNKIENEYSDNDKEEYDNQIINSSNELNTSSSYDTFFKTFGGCLIQVSKELSPPCSFDFCSGIVQYLTSNEKHFLDAVDLSKFNHSINYFLETRQVHSYEVKSVDDFIIHWKLVADSSFENNNAIDEFLGAAQTYNPIISLAAFKSLYEDNTVEVEGNLFDIIAAIINAELFTKHVQVFCFNVLPDERYLSKRIYQLIQSRVSNAKCMFKVTKVLDSYALCIIFYNREENEVKLYYIDPLADRDDEKCLGDTTWSDYADREMDEVFSVYLPLENELRTRDKYRLILKQCKIQNQLPQISGISVIIYMLTIVSMLKSNSNLQTLETDIFPSSNTLSTDTYEANSFIEKLFEVNSKHSSESIRRTLIIFLTTGKPDLA